MYCSAVPLGAIFVKYETVWNEVCIPDPVLCGFVYDKTAAAMFIIIHVRCAPNCVYFLLGLHLGECVSRSAPPPSSPLIFFTCGQHFPSLLCYIKYLISSEKDISKHTRDMCSWRK
jgi:hypothetical protein